MPEIKQKISITTGTMVRAVLVALGVYFAYLLRDLVGIVLVSILLAAIIDPLADLLEKKKIPRSITVLITYILLFLIAGVILFAIIPPMIVELHGMGDSFRSIWSKAVSSFDALRTISARYGFDSSFQMSIEAFNDALTGSFNNLFATITGFLGGLVSFFVVLAISYFLVVEKHALRDMVVSLVPARHHDYISSVSTKMQHKLGQWLIGQLVLMLFIGVLSYIGLAVFGVKYAVLLAVLAGFLEIVPYLGPVVATIPAAFFAFADSPTKAVLIIIFYLLVQRIEHMILTPKIMQKATGLNPIFAVLALAIGFTVGGIAGILLAIPVAAVANVILAEYIERQNKIA